MLDFKAWENSYIKNMELLIFDCDGTFDYANVHQGTHLRNGNGVQLRQSLCYSQSLMNQDCIGTLQV